MAPGPGAGTRIGRALAMLPWIAEQSPVSVDDIAERFGLSSDVVRADIGILMVCGRGERGGGDMIEVLIDEDDTVTAEATERLARPVRLNRADGLAVMAAATLMAEVPGAEAEVFHALVDKLRAVVDVDVDIDVEQSAHLGAVQAAEAAHDTLEIDHWSLSRDEPTTRRIDPYLVHYSDGHWYVEAHDHLSGERRRFRLSRIVDVRTTGERFEPPADAATLPPRGVFDAGEDMERVTLRVGESDRWITEAYPCEDVTEVDGGVRVTVAVGARPWLERLLLRLGPDAVVESPEHATSRADAARRVLARYA